MVVNTVRHAALQFSKINRTIFLCFTLYAAVNSGDCKEKSSPPFEARFGTVKGKLMLFNIIEKSKVSWTNFRDKLQFVNSVKRLVFDLTKYYSSNV